MKQKPVAWLIEFENGEQELHFHDANHSLGSEQIALYAAQIVDDDVLQCLRSIIEYWDAVIPPEHLNEHHKAGRAAIAKATGGAQ